MNEAEKLSTEKPPPWYFKNNFVFLMLFIFGPFALPLVWLSPKFSKTWKMIVTLLAIVVTILLAKTTTAMYQTLIERLKDIQAAGIM